MLITDILQPTHLLLVLVVALLVLGPQRLPEVSRAIGRSLRDFQGAFTGEGATAAEAAPAGRADPEAAAAPGTDPRP